jgi:hypothetical protein
MVLNEHLKKLIKDFLKQDKARTVRCKKRQGLHHTSQILSDPRPGLSDTKQDNSEGSHQKKLRQKTYSTTE